MVFSQGSAPVFHYLDGYRSTTGIPSTPLLSLQVTFAARSGRTYRIEESADLRTWVTRENGITGNGVIITRQVPARGAKGFVRVREE